MMMRNRWGGSLLFALVFGLAIVWVIFGAFSLWEGQPYGLGFLIAGIAIGVALYLIPYRKV